MAAPKIILSSAVDDTGDPVHLGIGVYNVEVVGDLDSASVQIEKTMLPSTLANFKPDTSLLFTEVTTKFGVVRGGCHIRADLIGTPAETIVVYIDEASA